MNFGHKVRAAACAFSALALLALAGAAGAGAGLLEPPGKKVWFGVSDTGDPASFGEFSTAVSKHPALIESFRTWGAEFPDSIRRWQTARARPMIHITTADGSDGHEIITPRAIAHGDGDEYLIRLNRLFFEKKMRAYVRPLGEPNRCLNVYASYDCGGQPRDAAHKPRWYKLAFRRIYVIVHGGGKAAKINERLAEAGLPPLTVDVGGLPAAPVAIVWSPLPAGSPTVPQNRPRHYYPGSRWVDWAGHRLLRLLSRNGRRLDRPLQPLRRQQAVRADRVGGRKRRRPGLRQPPLRLGATAPALQDARLLPGLRHHQQLPDPELPGQPRGAQGPPPLAAFPAFAPDAPHLPPPRRWSRRASASLRFASLAFGCFAFGLNGCSAVMLE